MINNPDLANSIKLKWVHGLAQTGGVLCNILKGMGQLAPKETGELSFAEWLAEVDKRIKESEKTSEKALEGTVAKKYRYGPGRTDWWNPKLNSLLEEILQSLQSPEWR